MIRQLTKLGLMGFRSYRKATEVPLDADVVIVYGPNGSGKTAMFSALEYALTGTVSHLETYGSDYPRSLQHIRVAEPGRVALSYRERAGSIKELTRMCGPQGAQTVGGEQLSRESAQFFRDRCYLSQARLSRLFEAYTESSDNESHQPLVAFARELLGLDPLENITDGLHVIMDARRLDNVSEPYRLLKIQREQIPGQRDQLLKLQATKEAAFETSILAVENALSGQLSQHGRIEWTEATLRSRRTAIEAEKAFAKRDEKILELQRFQGRLENSLRLLESHHLPTDEQKRQLRESLERDTASREFHRERLKALVSRLEILLREGDPRFVSAQESTEPEHVLAQYETAAQRLLEDLGRASSAAKELQSRVDTCRNRRNELQAVLRSRPVVASEDSADLREWIDLLRAVTVRIRDETCPVCSRDYSEVKAGSLKARIEERLQRLGGDISRLNQAAAERAQLEAEYSQANALLEALERQIQEQAQRLIQQQNIAQRLTLFFQNELPLVADVRKELSELAVNLKQKSELLERMENQESQYRQIAVHVEELAGLLKIAPQTSMVDLAKMAVEEVRSQTIALSQAERAHANIIVALSTAERAAQEYQEVVQRVATLESRREQIEEQWRRVENCVTQARTLVTAAVNAKKTLLDDVFDSTLNGLWKDLFRRLVKSDRFTPQLKLIQKRGRQLQINIEGHSDSGVSPFAHVGSVLSAGNFNTAALSLFLSIHLLEEPKHEVLVLDDPVQNIDDVHVVQLASLLRTIVHEAGRQLIVGVHERALFDYLCLELGPTNAAQSMLAIELTGGSEHSGTTVRCDRRIWRDDKLQLGA
jgi:exonuclease SbcC